MTLKDRVQQFRTRIDPARTERAARSAGKSEDEIAHEVKRARRRRRLLRSGGAGGGSFGG